MSFPHRSRRLGSGLRPPQSRTDDGPPLIDAARKIITKAFTADAKAVNCHHNYVQKETHFGHEIYVTRKGAVTAHTGQLGIIPGSMGAKSYIVRGKGNPEPFSSCSHGAGRIMSRTAAKKRFSVKDQERATVGVECRKDADVIDELSMEWNPQGQTPVDSTATSLAVLSR